MTGPEYVGAIDQGTTGTRFVVFDRSGSPVADAFTRHARRTPRPDWVEYDPREIWGSTTDAIQRGLAAAGIDADALGALAVANQRQTSVVWDHETGEPVHAAISWQDRRTADRVTALKEGTVESIRERTGLVPDAYFAAPKLEWLLDNAGNGDGQLRERAAAGDVLFGTVDSWLAYNLTGNHVTDVTNAAQTMLFDVHEMAWDEDLLAAFDVPAATLPEVRPSSDPVGFGRTDPEGILDAELPVAGMLGDQQASLVGQAGFGVGDAKVTFGAGNFFLQNTGDEPVRPVDGLLSTVLFQRAGGDPLYALEGPVFTTGTALEWLEEIGLLEDAGTLASLARTVDSTGGVYAVPAFGGLGAPDWDQAVQGAIVGLSRHTTGEHVVRATLESIAFGTRAVVETAEAVTDATHDRLLVDGGAVHDDDFCQLQADRMGVSLTRPAVTQTTARGAAFAAGLAVGTWDDVDELREMRTAGRTFQPDVDRNTVDDRYRTWRDVVDGVRALHRRLH